MSHCDFDDVLKELKTNSSTRIQNCESVMNTPPPPPGFRDVSPVPTIATCAVMSSVDAIRAANILSSSFTPLTTVTTNVIRTTPTPNLDLSSQNINEASFSSNENKLKYPKEMVKEAGT